MKPIGPSFQYGICYRLSVCITFLLGLLALNCAPGWADGGFVPPVSFEKPPSIPYQSAVISHRNGIETLVVESSAQREKQMPLAWVIPVPSPPLEIKAMPAGMMRGIEAAFGPEIINEGMTTSIGWPLVVLMLLILTTIAILTDESKERQQCIQTIVIIVIFSGMTVIAVPDMGGGGNIATPQELQRVSAGNYDVTVLQAGNSDELAKWLTDRKFAPFPAAAQQTVNAYIRDKWVFLVASLNDGPPGLATPHPLSIRFRSDLPVYPMRLTAMANSAVQVKLFVLADQPYSHPLLKTVVQDKLTSTVQSSGIGNISALYGSATSVQCAHPGLIEVAADTDWLTHLSGTLQPGQMISDLAMEPLPASAEPYREKLYTTRAAAKRGVVFAMWTLCVFVPVLVWTYRSARARVGIAAVAILVFVGIVGAYGYHDTPVTPARTIGGYRYKQAAYKNSLRKAILTAKTKATTTETLQQLLAAELPKTTKNFFTNEPIRKGDAPGDYDFATDPEGNPVLVLYARDSSPDAFDL